MLKILEQLAGVILGILVLTDIFLIVPHARADSGLTSRLVSYPVWRFFVWLSKPLGRWRGPFLSYSGPLILVMVLGTWFLLLSLAAALVIHPNLGTAIRASHGETPTDFVTALYVGGNSLALVGTSDFAPQNASFRWFYLLTSISGMALVPLIITYLLEVYASLWARNSLGLEVQLHSVETGDAAQVIAALCPPEMGRSPIHAGY